MGHASRWVLGVLTAAVVLAGGWWARADKWEPHTFKGPAFYKYRITSHEEETREVIYGLDVKATEQTSGGEPLYQVTTSTQTLMKQEDLKVAAVFGASPLLTLAPTLMLGNPMFGAMIGQMELEVGEKMSFFGAGYAKVVAKETVAGVEGWRCELYIKQGEAEEKQAEITVHPDLALPLRSRTFEDGKVRFEMELLEYHKN